MFGKIMVPLDGSMLSEKALPYALRLANQLGAKLCLIRVVNPKTGLYPPTTRHEATLVRQATEYLAYLHQTLTNPDQVLAIAPDQLETCVVYGSPAKEISNFANISQADLIVMSTHGRGNLNRLMSGSVATYVTHHSTVPVMLIHPFEIRYNQILDETLHEVDEPLSPKCFSDLHGKILLTLDGTIEAETALEPALQLAALLKASLYLLHVSHPLNPLTTSYLAMAGYNEAGMIQLKHDIIADAYSYLERIALQAQARNIPCTMMVTSSETPTEEISRYADEIEAELIIMAPHAASDLSRAFNGSITESTVQHSHRPILLMPTRSKATSKVENLTPQVV